MQIHVDRGGQRFGPYSLEEVNRYLADGTLLPSDIGWHDGAADWVPLTQIAGVQAGGGPPAPPGPPAPTAADAAKPKAPEMAAGAPAAKGKGGAAIKIAAIVLLIAGLGAGGYFFIYPKYFAKGGGDNNGTSTAAWQTLPGGAPILGGADVVFQLKAGEIFKSSLIQQQLGAAPDAGMMISMMQQNSGIGPGDLLDLTISASGVSTVAQSIDDPDKSDEAFFNAYKSGKLKYALVLRSSKPVDKEKIEELITQGGDKPDFNPAGVEQKTHAKTKYFLFKNDAPPEPDFAAYFADDKTLVFGLETVVQSHIDLAGKISARSGLEFLNPKNQITIAYLPPDNKAISSGVSKILKEMKIDSDAPPIIKDLFETAKKTLESLKKVEAAALSGGITQNGLKLAASANFSDTDSAKSFSDSFNKLLKEAQKIPEVAQSLLAAQGMGIVVPSAESKEKQASLKINLPMDAMDSLGGMMGGFGGSPPTAIGGSARHSQATLKRWTILKQTVGRNQWPAHTVVEKNLGKADNVQKNVTMNTRMVATAGAAMPTLSNTPQVPGCIRWDYFDAPRGQRAIQLYFNPKNGQMIGVHWFESGPQKIGIPGGGGGGGRPVRPGGNRPNTIRPQGGQKGFPGANNKGGFRPKGTRPNGAQPRGPGTQLRPQPDNNKGQAALAPPQSAAEAQQRLKGSWVRTTGSEVTLTFGENNRFSTDAGSGPKTGNYRIIGVSGNNITFTGLHSANIASLTLNGPSEFTVRQSSMLGVIPKGTFRRN